MRKDSGRDVQLEAPVFTDESCACRVVERDLAGRREEGRVLNDAERVKGGKGKRCYLVGWNRRGFVLGGQRR